MTFQSFKWGSRKRTKLSLPRKSTSQYGYISQFSSFRASHGWPPLSDSSVCVTWSMCVCVCEQTWMYMHICLHIYICAYMYTYVCIYMYAYVCDVVNVCVCVCMRTDMNVYAYMSTYMCVHICIHMCVYIYTIFRLQFSPPNTNDLSYVVRVCYMSTAILIIIEGMFHAFQRFSDFLTYYVYISNIM